MQKSLTSCLCFMLIIILSLGAAEGVIRLKNSSMKNYDIEMWKYALKLKKISDNPILGHEHIPSKRATLQSVNIRTNNYGLRGPNLPSFNENQRRILFLGSSVTLGWGVPEENTLTDIIQQKFNAQSQDVYILNAGIGNYNTTRYVERFFTRLQDLKPTDIVVQFILRDAEILPPAKKNNLLRHSQLATTAWIVVSRYYSKVKEPTLEEHYNKVYASQSRGFIEMQQGLERLAAYCKAHHIRLYLAMTPDTHDLIDYKFTSIHQQIQQIATSLGYTYIDLLPALKGFAPKEVWIMPGDPHPNALGHEKMAEFLFPLLSEPVT